MRNLSIIAVVLLGLLAVGYLQYSRRVQVDSYLGGAMVAQGLQTAAAIRVRVEEYYWTDGEMPADNAQVGMPAPELVAPSPVRSVTVMRGGVIHVEYDDTLGAGSTLTLFPSVARGSDRVDWACSVKGIDPERLNILRPPCVRTPQSPIGDLMQAVRQGDDDAVRHLLARGLDVNQQFQGDRPLPAAVDRGRLDITGLLLEAGADPDQSASYYNGQTPLMIAATHRNVPLIRLLLGHGARADRRDRHGKTALDYAAASGTRHEAYRVLAEVSQGYGSAAPGGEASTGGPAIPLLAAVASGSLERVEAELKGDALEREDTSGETALFYALRGSHPAIAERLIAAGAQVNHRNLRGETPLMVSAEYSDVGLVDRLVAAGAVVDPAPENGDSPLIRAIHKRRYAVADRLLHFGADPARNGSAALIELVGAPAAPPTQLLERLLAADADANVHDRSGVPVLVVALRLGYHEAVKALLAHGAKAQGDAKGIVQPVVMAAESGDTGLVQAMLKAGADVNASDREGRTPLHAAVDHHAYPTVRLLLKAGADPDREDAQGISAREIASAKYYQDIVQLFDTFDAATSSAKH